jgi:hypothetical protein
MQGWSPAVGTGAQGGSSALVGDPETSGDRETGKSAFPEAISKFGRSGEATHRATVGGRDLHDPRERAGLRVVVEQRLRRRFEGEGEVVWSDEELIDPIDGCDLLAPALLPPPGSFWPPNHCKVGGCGGLPVLVAVRWLSRGPRQQRAARADAQASYAAVHGWCQAPIPLHRCGARPAYRAGGYRVARAAGQDFLTFHGP